MYTNAQSIVKKMNELRVKIEVTNPDIIAIVETWCNEGINGDFLCINGYELIERKDRNDTEGGRGGGILVYAKKELNVWSEEVGSNFNQAATIKIKGEK